jgi:hypothetical protein
VSAGWRTSSFRGRSAAASAPAASFRDYAAAALERSLAAADERSRLRDAIAAADDRGAAHEARALRRELARLALTQAGRLHGPGEVAALVDSALSAADAADAVLDALAVTLHPISNREEAA